MKRVFHTFFTIFILSISLTACNDDTSISSSGGGAQSGDGGSLSAQYAGIYRGTMSIRYEGKDFDVKDNLATSLQINTDGTVILSLDGKTVNGVINGTKISISLKVKRRENATKCTANVTIKATVAGNMLSGPVLGDGECEVVWIDQSAKISGTIRASRF